MLVSKSFPWIFAAAKDQKHLQGLVTFLALIAQ
jgi:hypothetical protein